MDSVRSFVGNSKIFADTIQNFSATLTAGWAWWPAGVECGSTCSTWRCEGKIVLVTGAQRGSGLNFLDDEPAAKPTAGEIAALGRRCCTLGADISRPEEARRRVAAAKRDWEGITGSARRGERS